MKTGLLPSVLVCVLTGLLPWGAAHADPFFNAHFKIDVNDGDTNNTVQSAFRLKPGGSKKLDLYPNTVEFRVRSISDKEYDLLVVVRDKRLSLVRLNHIFRGTYGVPLELKADEADVHVSGAISVVVLNEETDSVTRI